MLLFLALVFFAPFANASPTLKMLRETVIRDREESQKALDSKLPMSYCRARLHRVQIKFSNGILENLNGIESETHKKYDDAITRIEAAVSKAPQYRIQLNPTKKHPLPRTITFQDVIQYDQSPESSLLEEGDVQSALDLINNFLNGSLRESHSVRFSINSTNPRDVVAHDVDANLTVSLSSGPLTREFWFSQITDQLSVSIPITDLFMSSMYDFTQTEDACVREVAYKPESRDPPTEYTSIQSWFSKINMQTIQWGEAPQEIEIGGIKYQVGTLPKSPYLPLDLDVCFIPSDFAPICHSLSATNTGALKSLVKVENRDGVPLAILRRDSKPKSFLELNLLGETRVKYAHQNY